MGEQIQSKVVCQESFMLMSMTGYGKSEENTSAGKISVELRSVNHRYSELSVKIPRQFFPIENEIRKRVSERFKRGKIDIYIQFEQSSEGVTPPQANFSLAKAYYDVFMKMGRELGLGESVSLSHILAQKDVLSFQDISLDLDQIVPALFSALGGAAESLESMRKKEGESLDSEIRGRVETVIGLVEKVASLAPVAVAANATRLRDRIDRFIGETQVDESRIAQEVAMLADRMDITEELVRLRSHFKQFFSVIALSEPVGRKLDFLLQEINREVNTIGSKANDADIAALVVEMKSELEKVREQVQNIE
jgi:uncharacterized protein (TIGR00255 family)